MSDPPNNLTAKLTALTSTLGGKLDTIAADIAALRLDMAALRGDAPSNTLQSINQSLWSLAGPAPGTTLTDLLRAVQASAGTDSSATISAILAAIGSLSSDPAGYTIKDLLALLQTSLDATPADKIVNQPTLPGTWTRQISWIAYPDQVTWQDALYDAYIPVFAAATQPFTLYRGDNVTHNRFNYLCNYGGVQTMRVCWNTTGHTQPLQIAMYSKTLGIGSGVDNSFLNMTPTAINFLCSMWPGEGLAQATGEVWADTAANNVQACGDGDVVVEWFVLYPNGVNPTNLDFFWSAS